MHPSVYVALCLLSASSSEATLISRAARTANHMHRAAINRSTRLAKDIRSVFSNVLIEQPIVGPDSGNHVYCVANPSDNVQNPTPAPTGGNGVIVSSITSGSSRRPSPTSTSGGSPQPTLTSDWKLAEIREGASFFDGWDFWSLPGVFLPPLSETPYSPRLIDPTHGTSAHRTGRH